MLPDHHAIIRLLLSIGQHEEVEAEIQAFSHQLIDFNWFNGLRFWTLRTDQEQTSWIVLPSFDAIRKGENAEVMFAAVPSESPGLDTAYSIAGKNVFFQPASDLILCIATRLEGDQLDGTISSLLPVIQKFVANVGRLWHKKNALRKRGSKAGPLSNLIINDQLQQRAMATISHELRNPLNLILGYTAFLRESGLNAVQNEYAAIINDSAQGLYQTVKKAFQLLNVATDRIVDEEMDFRIADVVRLLEAQLKPQAEAKGLIWSVQLSNEAGKWLKGDMTKLHDVLYYLIENAIKFSTKGPIEIKATCISTFEGQLSFEFVISDQGKGVEERHQQRIFEFFNQEDDSITRNYGGLGLGLSLAELFVSRLGGKLALQSNLGHGSSFSFQLSFAPCDDHKSDNIASFLTDPAVSAKIKVLIVDDDQYQRKMAAHILRNWNVSFADSGLKAINHIRANPETDIILMDIRMPEMDGITAARIIRNELKYEAPIIAVSGEAMEATIKECFEAGMNAFVSKPFEREQLLRTMLLHCAPIRQVRPDVIKLRPVDKLSGLKGLVVEDNKMIQLLTMRYLRDLECNAALAMDVETALEKIANNEYDFILLDLHLPDGTGYEVARSVRRNDHQTCIIAYSGEDSDETRSMCHAAGINGIILKSYHTAQELAIKINRYIQEHRPDHAYLQHETESQDPGKDYDLAQVKEIVGDSSADLVLLLEVFVEHSGNTLNQLIEANRNNDLKTLSCHAHSLKSSVRQFGMKRAADLLFALELRTGNLDLDQRNSMCEELKTIFSRALPDMANEIQKMKS